MSYCSIVDINGFTIQSLSLSLPRFELNTCIEPPHDGKVTSLIFQPPPPLKTTRKTESVSEPTSPVPLFVSTSDDGKFKSWVLVDSGLEGEKKRALSWACRSAGYYHSLPRGQLVPCRGACFSGDGSLLAVNFTAVSFISNLFSSSHT